jgi:steroid 5-alpha reductase family enzyme
MRTIFFTLMVSSWSLRLTWHLYKRVKAHHPQEDARYQDFRKQWGKSASFNFFWFFQMQALILFALSAPSLVVSFNNDEGFGICELAGAIIFLIALVGETQADNQLNRFKKNPKNKNEVCNVGLWKYSRHPNYFFEWVIWCSFFVYALGSPFGIFTLYCPLLMLFFLLKVSGVPLAEEQSLKSKGDKYRIYQSRTSVFFPWFRKAG